MNRYQLSIKILKSKIYENKNLTEDQWDKFAQENSLFSSFTLQAHQDVIGWGSLKLSLEKSNENIKNQIEKYRKKLHKQIQTYGLCSEEVLKINIKIHEIINWYYANQEMEQVSKEKYYPKGNKIYQTYQQSYQEIKKLTKKQGEFPKVENWNSYAIKNNLLCNISIEYISGENWNQLRKKIIREIHHDL